MLCIMDILEFPPDYRIQQTFNRKNAHGFHNFSNCKTFPQIMALSIDNIGLQACHKVFPFSPLTVEVLPYAVSRCLNYTGQFHLCTKELL